MAEEKKKTEVVVPKEEIQEIKSLQEKYQGIALQLGQASLHRSQLNKELDTIESNEQKLLVTYDEARELFLHPDVTPAEEVSFKWKEPDLQGLIDFMVKEKGFSEDRMKSGVEKLKKGLKGGVQGRLDGFFKAAPKPKDDDKKRNGKEIKGNAKKKSKK